jgi:hypothetical protein
VRIKKRVYTPQFNVFLMLKKSVPKAFACSSVSSKDFLAAGGSCFAAGGNDFSAFAEINRLSGTGWASANAALIAVWSAPKEV